MNNFITKCLKHILISFFWLSIWQFIYFNVNKEILLVSPFHVFARLKILLFEYDFWITVFFSLLRILTGYIIGITSALIIAVITKANKIIYDILHPVIVTVKSTPVASFIILTLVWIKSSYIPIFITVLMVMPIVWNNVYNGISNTDIKLLEMSKIFNFNIYKKIRFIYIPTIKPYFISSCITSLGLAWKSGIAAEIISLPHHSIGYKLYSAKLYINTADLFSWTIVIIVLSIILEKLISAILKKMS